MTDSRKIKFQIINKEVIGVVKMMFSVILISLGCLFLSASFCAAETIRSLPEPAAKVDVCSISKTVVLGKNIDKDIYVRAVEIYLGPRSDVSPPIRLLLTYFNGAEMNNTRTAFYLGRFMEIDAYKRLKAGLYQVSGTRLDDAGVLKKVVLTIDAAGIFMDDGKVKSSDFKNPYFLSTIKVTEKVTSK